MTQSLIFKLVQNDFKINRKPILLCWIFAVIGLVIGILIPGLVAMNIGFSILVCAISALGFHLMSQTIIFDKIKSTRTFIMSLPVTFKQYTIAKVLVNFLVFYVICIALSLICLFLTFSQGLFPAGSLPMMSMVLLSFLPAYSLILTVCIISQSIAISIVAGVICSAATSAYLWTIVYFESVGPYVWGSEAVWNSTVISVMLAQISAGLLLPLIAVAVQGRKKDFI